MPSFAWRLIPRSFGLLIVLLWSAAIGLRAAERPNIIILFADDLGYGDLGCYGHPSIRTPNLDRMAAEGMRFTDFYSAAEVCTPSRAALLTGRYPVRNGMCHERYRVLRPNSTGGLPHDELTLPELLKTQGYHTACIGKWHLGVFSIDPLHHPARHGFDFYFGLPHSNDMDPAPGAPHGAPRRLDQDPAWWNAPLYRNEALIERPADQSSLTRRYTQEAVRFIRDSRRQPFFLYVPYSFPHVPLFASENFHGKSPRGLYGDVVEELDWSVGEILKALRDSRLDRETLVIFTSDNGPWLTQGLAGGSAGLLREGKGSTWEGGMRVPAIMRWPGRIPAGVVSRELACAMDLFTTSLQLAGAETPADRPIDGMDLSPVLFGTGPSPRASFFYYRGPRLFAARLGPHKAHFMTRSAYGSDPPEEHEPPLLFDLGVDPGESVNIAREQPLIAAEIRALADRHKATVTPAMSQLEVAREKTTPRTALPQAPASRPNVLFLLADDQRADTIGAWGNPHIQTPHLDRLVAEGFSFRGNYCFGGNSGAVCVPSRAMLMSGRTWFRIDHQLEGARILPEVLRENGYVTFATGKWHNGPPSFLRGFTMARAVMFGGMADHTKVPVRDLRKDGTLGETYTAPKFSSETFADAAIEFLEQHQGPEPFFAYVAFTASHDPRNPPADAVKPYRARKPPLPENFLPQHPFDNGQLVLRDENLAPWPRSEEIVRDQLAEYYGLITHLDGQVGRILAALERSPAATNTLVIYAADHGLAMGSHGLLGKQNVYEHSMRCPLIIAGPGIPSGRSTTAFTYLFDLMPTLLRMTGAPPPDGLDGLDLRPLWTGEKARLRDSVFLPYINLMRAVRDERWKLICYPPVNHVQLFDLKSDPHERHNLAADPAFGEHLDRLRGLMASWQRQAGDELPLTVENPRPLTRDLTGTPRRPDQWQPEEIRAKYFDPIPGN
jgi:arylsulfatase A-like enzyme